MSALDDLDRLEADAKREDKICIQRDHASGDIAWRFATVQMSPVELLEWAKFYSLMTNSGYKARIEELERKIEDLTTRRGDER